MALIVQGGLAATTSGRIGNTVFSRNRGGAYVRNYVKPVNPRTALQAAIRNAFATAVSAWKSLSSGQQGAYASAAVASPVPNRVGLMTTLPPLAMFQRINVGRIVAGLAIVPTAPPAPITDDWNPGAFQVTPTGDNAFDVTYDGSSDWIVNGTDQDALLIFLSPIQSAGVNFYKGKYNFALGILGGTNGQIAGFPGGFTYSGGGSTGVLSCTQVSGPQYFKPPGQKLFVRAYVTRADGRTGPDANVSGVTV